MARISLTASVSPEFRVARMASGMMLLTMLATRL